jgi:hypothetical protein
MTNQVKRKSSNPSFIYGRRRRRRKRITIGSQGVCGTGLLNKVHCLLKFLSHDDLESKGTFWDAVPLQFSSMLKGWQPIGI